MAEVKAQKLEVSNRARSLMWILMFVGGLTFLFGLVKTPERIWPSFLVSYWFFLSLGLGGLFFTAVNNVASTGWNVVVRRYSEAMAAYLPYALGLTVVLLFGVKHLYAWLNADIVAADPLLQFKSPYLNWPFFLIRIAAFFGVWLLFNKWIVGNSLKQDESGEESLTKKNLKLSVIFVMLFALTYSFYSVDLLMSLEPHWFSTIFGVYCFSGMFQSSMAVMILLLLWMRKHKMDSGVVNDNHVHDLAKYMKAFTVFYAYIAFSQFMLIWYANMPEETVFYLHRAHHGWMGVSLSIIFLKFIVPFIALLPRWAKRSPGHLTAICFLLIVMQMVDVYWLVYPNFNDNHVVFGWAEIGIFLGFLGLFMQAVTRFLSKHNTIPQKDPYLKESLQHVVTY